QRGRRRTFPPEALGNTPAAFFKPGAFRAVRGDAFGWCVKRVRDTHRRPKAVGGGAQTSVLESESCAMMVACGFRLGKTCPPHHTGALTHSSASHLAQEHIFEEPEKHHCTWWMQVGLK
ncbi:hypothetical protein DQ04_25741000, partial [Trypanosoma grayi]|uniref:hypothetical protein n=1 Tax=Trypanosoma grayi TaxID=71804 RepID=UPI0004F3FCB7